MGLKETRQTFFDKWAGALVEKDWELCDICSSLIIDTLPDTSEQKTRLMTNINEIQNVYNHEILVLHEMLTRIRSPIKREDFKESAINKLENWKAKKIRHMFLQVFMRDSLIVTEK